MLGFCVCPAPTAIQSITAITCGEDFGQIQKLVFQRRQTTQPFDTVTEAGTLANWTTLKGATDSTKVVSTPFFENFVVPPVEAIKEGGDDNTTLDGVAIVVGESSPFATGNFRSLPVLQFEELQKYTCETDLTVYMINEFGKIIAYSSDGTKVAGIPITNWYIGDKGVQGKNTNDKNMFTFAFRPGWSKKTKIITPVDFDARFDI